MTFTGEDVTLRTHTHTPALLDSLLPKVKRIWEQQGGSLISDHFLFSQQPPVRKVRGRRRDESLEVREDLRNRKMT